MALDDGTGHISKALTPLFDAVTAMAKPKTGLDWLSNNPQVSRLLTGLATGQIELTHQALAELPNWRTVAYLRDLLMSCGVLPATDKQVLHFETWLHHRLNGLDGQPDTAILRQYALWHQLARLRRSAQARPLPASTAKSAMAQFNTAARLCAWLHDRGQVLARATQADIDAWHAAARPGARQSAHAFLAWAIKTGHMPRRALPPLRPSQGGPVLSAASRLDLLSRALTDDQVPLRTRAGACLLLFAQPVTRIVRLTIDDIIRQDGQLLLRVGDPPARRQPAEHRHRDQPRQPVAVPRPPGRPAPPRRHAMDSTAPVRHPRDGRPNRRPAPARPPGPGPRHRPGPRLQPSGRAPPRSPGRPDLGPLRHRRPQTVTTSPAGL